MNIQSKIDEIFIIHELTPYLFAIEEPSYYQGNFSYLIVGDDALVSKRCYKEPMSFEEADNIMMSSFGTSFDPSLQKYYVAVKKDIEAYYTEIRKNTQKTTT